MFQTDIGAIEEAAMEMQQQIRKWNRAVGETEDIAGWLGHVSSMEAALYQLKKNVAQEEAVRQQLFRMTRCLKQIEECYGACETGIVDYAEGVCRKPKESFGWFRIEMAEEIAKKIKQIIY